MLLGNKMPETDLFNNKYRVSPARLACFDYGSNALYFITICTKHRVNYFGEIVSGVSHTQNAISETLNIASPQRKENDVSETPNIASREGKENDVSETPNIASREGKENDVYETQNIASLRRTDIGEIAYENWLAIPDHFSFVELDEFVIMPNHIHGILYINKPDKADWQVNKFGVQSQNLASVIRGYKSSVKTYSTINNIEFGWQPRYYDRVIRDEREYLNVKEYIYNNPEQWLLNGDKEDNFYKP